MSSHLRQFRRFDSREKVELVLEGREEMRSLWTQDVSRGGLFVQTASPPDLGTRLSITLTTPDGSVTLSAEVVHVLPPAVAEQFGRSPGIGVQFVDMSIQDTRAIERYIDGIAERLAGEDTTEKDDAEDVIHVARALMTAFED
ncbi:MAG: hypothetical protein HC923_02575, partial [Myxococcales bacterium]|nr:hypothetical protein [Myxococcales bacterium]